MGKESDEQINNSNMIDGNQGGMTQRHDLSTYLPTWAEAFIRDRQIQNLSDNTIEYYKQEIKIFLDFCEGRAVSQLDQLTPDDLRAYLLWMKESRNRNPGGVAAGFRAVRAFLLFYENEAEPEGWKNPIRKVRSPKSYIPPLEPADLEVIQKMVRVCGGDQLGLRDKAIILCLLDSGCRASEFVALDLDDIDQVTGRVLVRHGKGDKARIVFFGKAARKALRAYLKSRDDENPAVWVSARSNRLTRKVLTGILANRANMANVEAPKLHAFRRACALALVRNGMSSFALKEYLGHSDIQTSLRYVRMDESDLRSSFEKSAPSDSF